MLTVLKNMCCFLIYSPLDSSGAREDILPALAADDAARKQDFAE